MKQKTGLVAYSETELVAWSRTLAMNELEYVIDVDHIDGQLVYLIYIDEVDAKQLEHLNHQYDFQVSFMKPV